ncbi:hemicentin-1-like [Penaeus indicus]|uniref:hemicentin-1-like n=1 Tax=Penaeus indicus TaxID=29960 RepID=UPI00300D4BB2
MTHVVRGVDANGALLVDVQLAGHVPYLPPGSLITLQPYNEDYVQTGGGSVFATSTRTFTLDGYHLPYAWNQTISYDAELGMQPYLVQTLHAAGLGSAYRTSQAELDVIVSASISPASNSGTCPSGFTLDSSGPYCRDNDECLASTSRCSHGCTNTIGSYSCDCNPGYTLGPDGYTCQDVDECSMAGVCGPLENCANTPGSYTCTYNCRPGLKRTASGTSCEDINECTETPGVCDQTCLNLIGGYRCDCRRGFRLVGQSRCVDIDECSQFRSPCTHGCENTVGSFRCSCPEGHMLLPNGRCKDINECATYQHDCLEEQECRNTEGSYICITHCPNGLTNADNGTCKDLSYYQLQIDISFPDIDECSQFRSPCTHGCENTVGSFRCSCPEGHMLLPNGRCKDINECATYQHDCLEEQECRNTEGSYICITHCPNGLTNADNGTCKDIDECAEQISGCHFTQTCSNTWGSYHCTCPRGFSSSGPGQPCLDVNECLASPPPCKYQCHNLRGTYECICGPGEQRLPDGKSCVGLQYLEEEAGRVALPSRRTRLRPAPGYPTSEFQERLLHSIYSRRSCREGFELEDDECRDVNECTLPERCQHRCENTIGSFMCLCPPGYRLNANRRTCDDINECREQDVQCGRDQLCFNLRGSYKCVSAPCPPEYQRDPATGSCILDCRWGKNSCPPGVTYAHILAFKTASLPAGIQAYQDLVRLMAYDQHGSLVPQTLFSIIENETGVAFRIRLEGGKGILSTLDPLAAGREYRMVVEAVSYDEVEHFIKYSTRFIIFLHISQYPY